MKKIIYILVFTALCSEISAQTDTLKLSLNQAIQLGLSNRFDAKGNRLNIDIAKNKLVKSKKEILPDISTNGKLIYNGQLQPSIIPAGYLGFTEPEKIAIGMKNNTAFALDINYTLFKPGLFTDIKIASNNTELEKEKNNLSVINLKLQIAEAYENVMLKSLQYTISQKNENRYKEYFDLAERKYKNGDLLESDMLLAELDYKNAVANSEKQKQNYMLGMQNLRYQINVPEHLKIILTDSLQSYEKPFIKDSLANFVAANRSEVKQFILEQNGFKLLLKKEKQNFLPSVSIFANYTKLFQGTGFDYSNNFYWAPVNYIGMKVSIPVTGSLKNINSVKEYNMKLEQTELKLKQTTVDVQYEVKESLTKLKNAEQNLVVARDNYKLSQKVYELKKQQYNLGSFSYEKLLDTEKSLNATEQDYITAVYNFLIAKINYQKAEGNF